MVKNYRPFRSLSVAVAFLFALAVAACAQNPQNNAISNIRIKNFGQMDGRFYRGGQPKEDDYKDLAALGVKTVIDLKSDPAPYEKRAVESLGMRYVNIPMSDKTYPRQEQIDEFLKIVNDPQTGKFFVHCEGGRHRTGVMGAVYRFNHDHWDYDRAYREMKDYDFYTRFGHGEMKRFVEDYWQQFSANQNKAQTAAAAK